MTTLIAPTQAGGTSTFYVGKGDVTLGCSQLGSGETITVEWSATPPATAVWVPSYSGGSLDTLTETVSPIKISSPGYYRVTLPVTAANVGVYLHNPEI